MNNGTQVAAAGISKEALSSLRVKIRAPLHQIISYCEIMAEDPAMEAHKEVSDNLGTIIDACQVVLPLTYQFHLDHDNLQAAVDNWREQLLEQSGTAVCQPGNGHCQVAQCGARLR